MNDYRDYSFNDTHPELLPGEEFLSNVDPNKPRSQWFVDNWELRLGEIAYRRDGIVLRDNSKPLFGVKK